MFKQLLAFAAVAAFVGLAMPVGTQTTLPSISMVHAVEPPVAMLCEEQTAELRAPGRFMTERADDFVQSFALVSDPDNACRHPDVAMAGGYDEAPGGRCYVLREIDGSGAEDVLLSCVERHAGDPGKGAPVAALRCSGWNHRVNAMLDGGFHLAATDSATGIERVSGGSCRGF